MTVVVGYVPTQTGLLALAEAAREARARDADVVVVNVVGAKGYFVPSAVPEEDLAAVSARLRNDGICTSVCRVDADRSVPDAILEIAHAADASLIVLGMHHRSRLAKRALGSTLRSVALAAPCPVLVVPHVDEAAGQAPLT